MSGKGDILVTPDVVTEGGPGKRFNENLRSAYAASPIHAGDMTDDAVREVWSQNVQSGDVTAAFEAYGGAVDSGTGNRMLDGFNVDFVDAPDIGSNDKTIDEKEFGAGQGAPTTPYIPPLTSPGPGSVSANDQPAFTGVTPDPAQQSEFGSGLGGQASPHETSPEVASQDTGAGLISGRSYLGSAG